MRAVLPRTLCKFFLYSRSAEHHLHASKMTTITKSYDTNLFEPKEILDVGFSICAGVALILKYNRYGRLFQNHICHRIYLVRNER